MDFKLPEIGEGIYEAELVSWLVKPGDTVKPGQNLMEVMTDKATMEIPAPFGGNIEKLRAEPGQQIKVGETVLSYQEAISASGGHKPSDAPAAGSVPSAGSAATLTTRLVTVHQGANAPRSPGVVPRDANGPSPMPVRAAPSVRLLARKLGVDLAQVRGSGPQGRILIDDLSRQLPSLSREPAASASQTRRDYGIPGQRIKLQGIRRAIAEHMARSTNTIPHYTYVDECDVTELVRVKGAFREVGERAGVKITYLPFVIKAVVEALKEVPLVNASLDEQAGEIVLHDRYHIGVAVDTPFGLIVPVIRDADKKDLLQLAREADRLSGLARTGKMNREDLQGGTFTITSFGNIGGLFATPIIPTPQVAILGIGKIVKRPIFDAAGQITPADMVYLSLSFDHRVLDGAVGAAFGNAVSKGLNNPLPLVVGR
jgi:pyruvate dehydrogenase E2 component (dihydrolipoamide acetyltransferase)/2-oxoisovalerate dehydrogenase E2 component (dihydrolipoyl transacylase)